MNPTEIDRRFNHHVPGPARVQQHEEWRARCKGLATRLSDLPPGREQSLAMTHLEEVMFWGNAAIARQDQ